jgi:nucleotide-binding universal stress UspA family protein
MTFHKILCPTDFSTGSKAAVALGARLAAADDAELVVAHSWHVPPIGAGPNHTFPANLVSQIVEDAIRALHDTSVEAKQLGARRVETTLLAGTPWDQIVTTLNDTSYDLVVMGTHGRTGLSRVLLGSIAERVVRHAPCSVMTIRPNVEAKPFTNVLCPIDFSESSRHALALATSLLRPGSKLTLLHVVEAPVAWKGEPQIAELLRDRDREATTELEAMAGAIRAKVPAAIPVVTRTRMGYAGGQILAVLDDDGYDLVVTGSHGRTGIRRALVGSVAEKIVRHANCPVLVARLRD